MQIPPTEQAPINASFNKIDSQLLQQISQLANRPLLLEKLVVNQAQGLLLHLAELKQGKSNPIATNSIISPSNRQNPAVNSNLTLQLPISLSKLFSADKVPLSLNLSVTRQQQVQLTINLPLNGTETNATQTIKTTLSQTLLNQPLPTNQNTNGPKSNNLANLAPLATTIENPIKTGQKNINQQVIVFQRGSINSSNTFKLDSPLQPSTALKANNGQAAIDNQLTSVVNKDTKQANTSANTSINRLKQLVGKLVAPSNNSSVDRVVNNLSSKIGSAGDFLTVKSAASFLLKSHFSEQRPIAQNLIQIQKLATELSTHITKAPSVKNLVEKIDQLLISIARPSKPTAEAVKSKIQQSGHFLENKVLREQQLIKNPQKPASIQQDKVKLENTNLNKFNQLDSSTIKNSNTATLTPIQTSATSSDLKQQLLQIKQVIEQLIQAPQKQRSEKTPQKSSADGVNNQNTSSNSSNPEKVMVKELTADLKTAINTTKNKATENFLPNSLVKTINNLFTEVKNVIAQIESNQLHSLRSEQPNLHQFLVDLPFGKNAEIDSFELLFEHSEPKDNQADKKRWKVIVRFDLDPLGPMFASIELEKDKISTHIFAESQQTAQLINQNLHVLKKSLFDAGVDVNKMQGSQGKIPEHLIENSDRKVDTHA